MTSTPRLTPTRSTAARPFEQMPMLRHKTVGEQLRLAREASNRSREEIAIQIRVSASYLLALERGHYRDLPSITYARQYTRLYATALRLSWKQLEPVYEEEVRVYTQAQSDQLMSKHRTESTGVYHQAPLLIPRIFKFGAVGMLILLVLVYFFWQFVQFLSPPELVILHPDRDMIVTERDIEVVGRTAPEAIVEMNGQNVTVDPDGDFAEQVYLHEGLNTIRVTVRSKRSQERVQVRTIIFNPPVE